MKICPACDVRFALADWTCPSCGWRAARSGAVHAVTGSGAAEGFSANFFHALSAAEETHFWFSARNALIVWALSRFCPGARTFLDVGCGNGQVARALRTAFPAMSLTASDAFAEGLATAAHRVADAEFVQADVCSLPWEDEFDVAGAFDVIEHIADDAGAVGQIARTVKPGGTIVVTVPQHRWLWTPIDECSGHVRRYSRAMLRARLAGAGLRVVYMTSFVSLLLPALVARRLVRRAAPADPAAELRIPAAMNAVGATVMMTERTLIRTGLRLPVGGSLLAIARR